MEFISLGGGAGAMGRTRLLCRPQTPLGWIWGPRVGGIPESLTAENIVMGQHRPTGGCGHG